MSTISRLINDNSVYHIVQRGNNKQEIFKEDEDFERFLSTVKRYIIKYKVELYHYCLMINHVHFLIKIFKKEALAKIMQGIFQSYRFYYRQKYGYVGYLYQGRYRSELVAEDAYLLECGRYIERNPVRADIVKKPDEYKWSSCIYYTSCHKSDIITENPLYGNFENSPKERRQASYKEYVSVPRPYEEIIDKGFNIA